MSVTAWKTPGTTASVDRGGTFPAWSNLGNVAASDDTRATSAALIGVTPTTDYARLTNFGFTESDIPSGATIEGIELEIEGRVSATGTTISEETTILRKTSGQVGSDDASGSWASATDATHTHGGATSLWGTTWADTDIAGNSDFGVDLAMRFTAGTSGRSMQIDFVRIRVHYSSITEVSLAGNQPAASGAFGLIKYLRALAGNQPAGSGVVRALSYATVAGNQPAGIGEALVEYLIALAGDQPYSTGLLTNDTAIQVLIEGNQPAATSDLASLYIQIVALAGSQDAPSGAFALIEYLIALAGNQNAPSATVSALTYTLLEGNQPSSSGALAVLYQIALSGDQPAASSALALIKYLVSIAGDQPAAAGALALEYFVSLAGDQPQSTGSALVQYLISLIGEQPGPSGEALVAYIVGLLGDQPSSSGSLLHEFLRFVYGLARYAPTAEGNGRHAPVAESTETRHAPITDNPLTRYAPTSEGESRHEPTTEGSSENRPTAEGEARHG